MDNIEASIELLYSRLNTICSTLRPNIFPRGQAISLSDLCNNDASIEDKIHYILRPDLTTDEAKVVFITTLNYANRNVDIIGAKVSYLIRP